MTKNSMRIFWNHGAFLQLKKKRPLTALWSPIAWCVFHFCGKMSNWSCEEPLSPFILKIWTLVSPTHGCVAPKCFLRSAQLGCDCSRQELSSAHCLIWACLLVFPWPPHFCFSHLAPDLPLSFPQAPGFLSLITTFLQFRESLQILYILGVLLKCHFLPKMPRNHAWCRLSTTYKLKQIFSPNLVNF